MIDTCYLHMEFNAKNGEWSINLPFVCTKCGVCCKLDDFLTAGPVKASKQEQPKLHLQLQTLYDELGALLEKQGQQAYDAYLTGTPCPFLEKNLCTIYPVRPEGCRMFPNTPFAMLSVDCEALDRFKQQRTALRRGRKTKEAFCSTGEPLKPAKHNVAQYQKSLGQLKAAGATEEELALFLELNKT